MKAKTVKVKITLLDDLLGTTSSNPDIHREFVASKAPDAMSMEEEVATLGACGVADKAMTIFPRLSDGRPLVWDYQVKGFFKDACGMLARVPGTSSNKLKAYRKVIDGLVFVFPRQIPLTLNGPVGNCQRPLRAETAQGPRVALAESESAPAGSTLECSVMLLDDGHEKLLREWLDYGQLRGLGQWRNSGKGRFTWEELAA